VLYRKRTARPSSSSLAAGRHREAGPTAPNSALRVKFWRGSAHNHSRPPKSSLPCDTPPSRKASFARTIHCRLVIHPFVLKTDVGQASKRRDNLLRIQRVPALLGLANHRVLRFAFLWAQGLAATPLLSRDLNIVAPVPSVGNAADQCSFSRPSTRTVTFRGECPNTSPSSP